MEIYYAPQFRRAFKKLPKSMQMKVLEKENLFKKNRFDASLRLHKLHGKLDGVWSFSVDNSYRVIVGSISDKEAHFLMVGNHDIYK